MNTYGNLMVVEYDKVRNDNVQGGYKYLIRSGAMSYTAYVTDKGFNDWLKRSNVMLEYIETNSSGARVAKIYRAHGVVTEILFWKKEELPENARPFKGLSNGSLVDCYYVHTETGSEIYRPNPNAKEIYKPMPIAEHIKFQSVHG